MKTTSLLCVLGLILSLALAGCATPAQTAGAIAGGVVGTTIAGGYSPANEIEQVYYLGVFDPQEQVPPTIYRITVHGQASAISATKFGSGWAPAPLVDSLNSHIGLDATDKGFGMSITNGEKNLANLQTGRRLIQFGPEGFREAPKDHRLVIVMGANPKAFFEAIDESLGIISGARIELADSGAREKLFKAYLQIQKEHARLTELEADYNKDNQP